jgi:hypothetical protein
MKSLLAGALAAATILFVGPAMAHGGRGMGVVDIFLWVSAGSLTHRPTPSTWS